MDSGRGDCHRTRPDGPGSGEAESVPVQVWKDPFSSAFLSTLNTKPRIPPQMVWQVEKRAARWSRIVAIVSVAIFLTFISSASRSFAATTHDVTVGGTTVGAPLAPGGVVWFNGYNPGTIVITAGDTVTWHLSGGVHTVTSTGVASNGSFLYDSSPLFTPAGALADMGPGKLLAPGSVFELDTSSLAVGTYHYFCKIHGGMTGNLTVTAPLPGPAVVAATAGWGDSAYAVQAFAPENLSVPRGTIVQWRLANPTEPHTITGPVSGGTPAWDSSPNFNPPGPPPVMLPGDTFTRSFPTAGTFTYFCKVHAYNVGGSWVGMVGTVIVESSPADALNTLSAVSYAALTVAVVALLVGIYDVVRRRKP